MPTDGALDVANAIQDLIIAVELLTTSHVIERKYKLAEAIDELLKNLLVARIDQYTVK